MNGERFAVSRVSFKVAYVFVLCVVHRLSDIETVARRRLGLLGVLLMFAGLGFGGCAQRPQEVAASHGKEYFPSSVYGRASPRVIADGQPVPRGGGQYMVGKPYTIAGRTYYPSESRHTQVGMASWYGDAFHGRLTANREIYDRDGFTAASPTMPLPCYARVTNLRNNYSMIVRVNDRGPYASDRIMDVSRRVAEALDYKRYGTAKVKVEYVGRASLDGSDDTKLFATLRTDGPARWQTGEPTLIAEAEALPARIASIAPFAPQRPHQRELEPAPRSPRYADDARPGRRHISTEEIAERPPRRPIEMASWEPGRAGHKHDAGRDAPESHQTRIARATGRPAMLPPSRPLDLATIPGAASQIHARHTISHVRLARARDE